MSEAKEGQQHPLAIYLWIWLLLFVLSTFSYLVDYFHLHGMLRWSLIILFMLLKAGFIVAIFMHMAWERLALKLAILLPPLCLLVLVGFMAIEGDYTFITRGAAFLTPPLTYPWEIRAFFRDPDGHLFEITQRRH